MFGSNLRQAYEEDPTQAVERTYNLRLGDTNCVMRDT